MDNRSPVNRRRVLQILGLGAASGFLVAAGCKKSEDEQAAAAPAPTAAPSTAGGSCQSKVPMDDEAKQLRRNLQYTEHSPKPDKNCANCSQYTAGQYGDCGGCKLFKGAVNPQGFCLSHAPIGSAPPAAPGAPVPEKKG